MLGNLGVFTIYLGTIDETEMKGLLRGLLPPPPLKGSAIISISIAPNYHFSKTNEDCTGDIIVNNEY